MGPWEAPTDQACRAAGNGRSWEVGQGRGAPANNQLHFNRNAITATMQGRSQPQPLIMTIQEPTSPTSTCAHQHCLSAAGKLERGRAEGAASLSLSRCLRSLWTFQTRGRQILHSCSTWQRDLSVQSWRRQRRVGAAPHTHLCDSLAADQNSLNTEWNWQIDSQSDRRLPR